MIVLNEWTVGRKTKKRSIMCSKVRICLLVKFFELDLKLFAISCCYTNMVPLEKYKRLPGEVRQYSLACMIKTTTRVTGKKT